MKIIPLSNSKQVAMVSDEDYELVRQYTWRLKPSSSKSYVCTSKRVDGMIRTIYLHRFIMNPCERDDVHHRNTNTLNNQRDNLKAIPHDYHGYVTRCENKLANEPDNIPF